ncbi:hypothetical protein pipiens_013392 [Culex pipiens pipiens]|uniref:Uncharacterized protein n=1 Tax=Culex pipiens pipiens TaxID=38569 RepID=A0ABD1CZT3_CULPP
MATRDMNRCQPQPRKIFAISVERNVLKPQRELKVTTTSKVQQQQSQDGGVVTTRTTGKLGKMILQTSANY